MNVMDLVAKISLDSQEYEKGVGNAKTSFAGLGSSIASGCKTIGKVGIGVFTALGGAIGGATTALIANAKATAEQADAIDKNSQKLGISTTAYQEWDFVLQHCGSSVDSLKGAMKTMNKSFESSIDVINKTHDAEAELDRQLDAGEITLDEYNKKYDELYEGAYKDVGALGQLGFSLQEISDMADDPDKAFAMIVEKLQQMPEGAERTALATDLLGKSAMELAPLLNMSAEETQGMIDQVHELGGVMEEDAVKAGASFQDSLANLKTTLTGAKNNLMGEFLPSLTTVMDGLTALFSGDDSGIGKIKQGIEDFASKLSEKLPKVLETIGGIAESLISALPAFFESIAQQLPSLISTLIPVLINAVVGLADAIEKALPQILSAIESNIGVITQGLTKVMLAVGNIIIKLLPKLLPMLIKVGLELIKALAKGFIENSNEVISAIFTLIDEVVAILTEPETLTQLLECGLQIILALATGILQNLPQLLGSVFTVLENVVSFLITDGIPMILDSALKLFEAIGDGALNALSYIMSKLGEILSNILGFEGLGKWLVDIKDGAVKVFEAIGDAVSSAWETIKDGVTKFGKDIWNGIKEGLGDMLAKGKELIMDLFEGIKSGWNKVKNFFTGGGGAIDTEDLAIKGLTQQGYSESQAKEAYRIMKEKGESDAEAYLEGQKKGLGINSPSRKMRYIGQMTMEGFSEGLEDESKDAFDVITDGVSDMPDIVMNGMSKGGSSDRISRLEAVVEQLSKRKEVIMVNVGGRQMEEIIIDAKQNVTTRSGGQAYV